MKVSVGASAVGERKNPKNEHLGVIFHAYGEKKNPYRIYTKFCTTGDIRDVITPANFGFDRFRVFNVASGQILGFSIGFRRRPYNTLALPCECVIGLIAVVYILLMLLAVRETARCSISSERDGLN